MTCLPSNMSTCQHGNAELLYYLCAAFHCSSHKIKTLLNLQQLNLCTKKILFELYETQTRLKR